MLRTQISQFSLAASAFISFPALAGGQLPINAEFNVLKPSTTGVTGEEVRVMTVDAEGNIWIAGRWPFWSECGIAMLPPVEQVFVPQSNGGFDTGLWTVWSNVHHPIPSPYIDDIAFTPDGVMWIASEGGLTRFDRHAKTPEQMWKTYNGPNSPLGVSGVRSLACDFNGHLWLVNWVVNGPPGVLFQFDPTTESWAQHLTSGIHSVSTGPSGKVYATRDFTAGFYEYNGNTWTYHGGGTAFSAPLEDLQGDLWFGAANGLWKWNGSSYQSFGQIGGSSSDITGISLGLDGTVYVSTWYGPVFKMINDTPVFFVDAQGLPRSVIERPNGDLFINNYGSTLALGRVRHYESGGGLLRRMNTYNSGLPDYFIDNIQTDHSGNVWFACGEGGLSRMLGSDGGIPTRWRNWGNHNDECEPYPWAGNEPMYSMYEDDQGFIWLGGNGIGKWDQITGDFVGFWNWQNSNLGVDSFVRIIQDKNGVVWAFSDYTGAYRYDAQTNDWVQKLFGAVGSTANYVNDATVDTDGNLWVATGVALHFFNGTQWFTISIHHGSPVDWPRLVAADPSGGIWIGSDQGLTRYVNGTWTHYDMSNSPIPANEVKSIDVRPDGLVGFSVAKFQSITPFPNGVVLFDGNNWQVFSYGTHPLPHYQLGDVEFDADGDIWVSCMSEGVVEIVLHTENVPGDTNGDGFVNVDDLLAVINAWGDCPAPPTSCAADLNGSGTVDVDDLLLVINNWN